jgi:hypothetical protein
MKRHCATGQIQQRAVAPMEEEEEETRVSGLVDVTRNEFTSVYS